VKSKDSTSGGGKKSKDTKSSPPPPKSPRSKSPRSKSPPKSKQTKQTVVSNDQTIATTTTTTNTVAATTAQQVDPQIEDAFDDLTLRCALYACFFQILIDRNEQDEALAQMERALNDMPRSTRHRLLIYRFKVITKSRMGLDVQMDLQKFREESEKNLAQMYRKVAISSLKHSDTISSYQRAIEALSVCIEMFYQNCLILRLESR
jgi:CCR4-NOT transcriptional regulation complex NOT5 subunit